MLCDDSSLMLIIFTFILIIYLCKKKYRYKGYWHFYNPFRLFGVEFEEDNKYLHSRKFLVCFYFFLKFFCLETMNSMLSVNYECEIKM